MTKRLLMALAVAGLLIAAMAIPSGAAGSVTGNDPDNTTIEPLLTRSHSAQIRTSDLGEGNIKSFTLSANGTSLSASITVNTPLPTAGNVALQAPYGGVHVMIMFQTPEQEDASEIVGDSALGCPVSWGSAFPAAPGQVAVNPAGNTVLGCTATGLPASNNRFWRSDGYRWWIYYGVTASECADAPLNADCAEYGLGIYEPDTAGELYVALGQHHLSTACPTGILDAPYAANGNTASAALSNGNKTVTITIPYTYSYVLRTRDTSSGNPAFACLKRTKEVVKFNQGVEDAIGFSWMDHEVGGPDPVGLIIGLTWYTDALPQASRFYGTWAGDGTPAAVPGPFCGTNALGISNQACLIDGPTGPQFIDSGLSFTG